MRELNSFNLIEINGGIKIGKLVIGMVSGAVTGLLRGIPGGPVGMFAGAVSGAGIGAVATAMHDADDIHDRGGWCCWR